MVFAHPTALWLLLLAPALAWLGWRAGGGRRGATATLQFACVAAVVLAIVRPLVVAHSSAATTVDVIDLGPAAADDAVRQLRFRPAGAVVFSSRAEVLADPAALARPADVAALRQRLARPLWPDDPAGGGTNLADALRLAGSQVPADGRGQIRLSVTGPGDHGDAAAEAWRLAQRGVAVLVEPVPAVAAEPFRVTAVSVPATARVGQTIPATVTIDATRGVPASIRLTAGDASPVTATATLRPGPNTLTVPLPLTRPGLIPIRVSAGATDAVRAAVQVTAPADVVLVQDGPDAGLAATLSALLGPSAVVRPVPPDALATGGGDPDVIVLADLPADHLPAAAQARLRSAVLGGTGLLLTGAARSFGPGGYDDAPLAPLLPVAMPQPAERVDPSTTLVLIIDTSGSMAGLPIDLAKSVARLAIDHLHAHDKVGLVEFYGGKRWAAPIQSAGNLAVLHRALDRLTAGGGTVLYPAVEEAAFALHGVHTRTKHVLLLSDGGVENERFADLVRRMADDGVTVSTVQVGPADTDNPMPDIARWGNGRFYTVPDPYALPDVSFKQPQLSLTAPLVRTPSAVAAGDDPLVAGVRPADLGTVDGYVRTRAKPTADVLLRTADGDPLLVRWRYGAGFVAALPTQLGSAMTRSVQDRPAFARLLADLVRQIGSNRGPPLRITTAVRPAGVEADVTAVDAAAGSIEPLQLTAADAAGHAVRTATADAIGPGHWNVLLPAMAAGPYTLTATLPGTPTAGVAGVAVPPPGASAGEGVLRQIASFAPLAAERAALLPATRQTFVDLQQPLAVAAAVLLLLHVAVRRWPARGTRGAT